MLLSWLLTVTGDRSSDAPACPADQGDFAVKFRCHCEVPLRRRVRRALPSSHATKPAVPRQVLTSLSGPDVLSPRSPPPAGGMDNSPGLQTGVPAIHNEKPRTGRRNNRSVEPDQWEHCHPSTRRLTWRTHSCVPCRHSWRHLFPNQANWPFRSRPARPRTP